MKGSKHVRKLTALALLAFMIVLTGCAESRGGGSGAGNLADKVENLPAGIAEKDPVKLMVVRKIGGDDHTAQFLAGAKQEGEALGFKVDTFGERGFRQIPRCDRPSH